jgi:hypothetical protein
VYHVSQFLTWLALVIELGCEDSATFYDSDQCSRTLLPPDSLQVSVFPEWLKADSEFTKCKIIFFNSMDEVRENLNRHRFPLLELCGSFNQKRPAFAVHSASQMLYI